MKISIKNISFGYTADPVFENFSLETDDSPLVILGPSGCGKTTLLRLMAGLEKPQAGEIIFNDKNTDKGVDETEVSFVFQESRLLPWMTALENVSLPCGRLLGKTVADERAGHFLDLAGLGERLNAYPAELSGGQKQRVAIARAFAFPGALVLMDEPFQSLDIPLRISLMDLTRKLLSMEERLLIAVTHDPREGLYLGSRIILLGKPGRGIVLDKKVEAKPGERRYASAASSLEEAKLVEILSAESSSI
ncbi:ABC transporter ATP-binding protein [Spirochaetia bacterium]|nr:ABC transporter ATP-binding protein [Spirochaetia bacterium]